MPELGFVIYLLAISYALGQFWYSILEIRHEDWMRTTSFPLLGIVAGEALWAKAGMVSGPEFFGVHVIVAFVFALIATVIDWGIHSARPTHEVMVRPAHA